MKPTARKFINSGADAIVQQKIEYAVMYYCPHSSETYTGEKIVVAIIFYNINMKMATYELIHDWNHIAEFDEKVNIEHLKLDTNKTLEYYCQMMANNYVCDIQHWISKYVNELQFGSLKSQIVDNPDDFIDKIKKTYMRFENTDEIIAISKLQENPIKETKAIKYLSIITNFGCHFTCPNCLMKLTGTKIPTTTISGLHKLLPAVQLTGANWVSISGGGDPLYEIEKHLDWYNLLFFLLKGIHKELHTSYTEIPECISSNFDRIIYHLNNVNQIPGVCSAHGEFVCVEFLVTEDFTCNKIDEIEQACADNSDVSELLFHQMVDAQYKPMHWCEEYLMNGSQKKSKWCYIKQGDHSIYYVENEIYTRFQDFI